MSHPDDARRVGWHKAPTTIENDWHRFYLEYPEIYDRFAITTPMVVNAMRDLVDFTGKVVIDAGSGTGRSTFALAQHAAFVYGVEPADPMRAVAKQKQRALGVTNVAFIDAAAPELPFADHSADELVSIYAFPWAFPYLGEGGRTLGERFLSESQRVLRPGGCVVVTDNAPGWYGGELVARLQPDLDRDGQTRDAFLQGLGFAFRDIVIEADYGSVEEAVATYGFIYGHQVIADLIAQDTRVIRWRPRLYVKRL
jgi:SAM-dependent methyltransferase